MNKVEELDCVKWLWSFLSPYAQDPDLPETHERWAKIFEAADRGLVLPRLAIKIAAEYPDAPVEVADYLEAALQINRRRNTRLRVQLIELLRALNGQGVVPIVMKGATSLFDDNIDIGSRVMVDIDICISSEVEQRKALKVLDSLGYEMRGSLEDYRLHHHFPPFFRDGDLASIELHKHLVQLRFCSAVNEDGALGNVTERSVEDMRYRSLDEANALKVSYVQCWLGCEGRWVSMMKWLDFLDRSKLIGLENLGAIPKLISLSADGETDRLFLTALSELSGISYVGDRDERLLNDWMQNYREPRTIRFLRLVAGNAFHRERWSGKGPLDVWNALVFRANHLKAYLRKSQHKDIF
jgi:hypothetical protein